MFCRMGNGCFLTGFRVKTSKTGGNLPDKFVPASKMTCRRRWGLNQATLLWNRIEIGLCNRLYLPSLHYLPCPTRGSQRIGHRGDFRVSEMAVHGPGHAAGRLAPPCQSNITTVLVPDEPSVCTVEDSVRAISLRLAPKDGFPIGAFLVFVNCRNDCRVGIAVAL